MATLLERLEKASPGRNFVFTAIETLKTPTEIKQFYQEYVDYLRQHGASEEIRANPEAVANDNIRYLLERNNKETANRWFKVLPNVKPSNFWKKYFLSFFRRSYSSTNCGGKWG